MSEEKKVSLEKVKKVSLEKKSKVSLVKNITLTEEDVVKKKDFYFVKKKKFNLKKVKGTWKKIKKPLKTAYKISETVSNTPQKLISLKDKANKNKTEDHGAETVRTINQTTDKVKSSVQTVKTVKNLPKTIKNLPKNVKQSVENTKKAAKTTAKVTKAVAKVTAKVVEKVGEGIAAIADTVGLPVVIVVVIILILVLLIFVLSNYLNQAEGVLIDNKKIEMLSQAEGLNDVEQSLKDGYKYINNEVNTIINNYRKIFDTTNDYKDINRIYYDDTNNNLRKSHLIQVQLEYPGESWFYPDYSPYYDYATPQATDSYKAFVSWDDSINGWNYGIDANDILSIAYVLLEKRENEKYKTDGQIYTVKFTKDIVEEILKKTVKYTHEVDKNRPYPDEHDKYFPCPHQDCEIKWEKNDPAYSDALADAIARRDRYYDAFEAWDSGLRQDIENYYYSTNDPNVYPVFESRIIDWERQYDIPHINKEDFYFFHDGTFDGGYDCTYCIYSNQYYRVENRVGLPDEYIQAGSMCYYEHHLHSVAVKFYSTEEIMDSYGFDDDDKTLADVTKIYFMTVNTEDN